FGRDPGGEEVVLQHGDPAAADGAVQRVGGKVVQSEYLEFVGRAVPGLTPEAVSRGIGLDLDPAAIVDRGHALQLAVGVAGPVAAAAILDLLAVPDDITAALEDQGLGDRDARRVAPGQWHVEPVLALGKRVLAAGGAEQGL